MAGLYNFTIKKGVEFNRPLIWKDTEGNAIDVTGMSAKLSAKVRRSDVTPVIEWVSPTNITVGTTDGAVTLNCTVEQGYALDFRYAKYDLFVGDQHLMSGQITVQETTINSGGD